MTASENFFDSIDGALAPEQAAQAFALAEPGDTGGKPDAGGAPMTTAATDNEQHDGYSHSRLTGQACGGEQRPLSTAQKALATKATPGSSTRE